MKQYNQTMRNPFLIMKIDLNLGKIIKNEA